MTNRPGRFLRGLALIVLAVIIAGAAIHFLGLWNDSAPAEVDFDRTGPAFVKLALIGLVLAASLIFARPRVGEVLSAMIFWGGLALILVAGYSMRYELETMGRNMLASLVPGMAVERGDGTVALARDRSGHYVLDARVDGAPVRFLVDTGASVVTLTAEDARAAGIDLDKLHFGAVVSTANGRAQVAPVRLSRVSIAGATLTNLRAFVARDGALDTSLFGMNALDRFSSWRVEGRRMILTP
ncbi:aspartyl protease family protein [Breoghania corrubedonensis]|uniref:Aspartyl protease family protein n=1 Tax=Breoghania corrubedonensis TaxID=665038 RepID=A0A2T5V1G6_9HYPH|nr:TIGR02281 family clan AA aspartic protease [Breoghania corrubedonensis]PTW57568.1 aspartyl protease family protein [Breoghania corrubedonensis]